MDNSAFDVFYHITGMKKKNYVNHALTQPTTTKNKENALHAQMAILSMKIHILV